MDIKTLVDDTTTNIMLEFKSKYKIVTRGC